MNEHAYQWQDHAACAGLNPRLFFPEAGESVKEALNVCAECPVKTECLQYALDNGERFGIYGGTTARDRKTLRRDHPRRQRSGTSHGTPTGHAWHLNHNETPCWACADANSRYQETSVQLRKERQR